MQTSNVGILMITQDEALRLVPYNDDAGNATVGYGHLLHRGPLNGTEVPVTKVEALQLFASDLHSIAEVYVNKITCLLNQNQYDALVSFCYNAGAGSLAHLVSETGLNQGNYAAVPPHILLYDKAKNQQGEYVVLPGLQTRRQQEATLFEQPVV